LNEEKTDGDTGLPIDNITHLSSNVFEESEEISEGLLVCPVCNRFYPSSEEIPRMLPDELRDKGEDIPFLKKWREKIPQKILDEGKPFNLGG